MMQLSLKCIRAYMVNDKKLTTNMPNIIIEYMNNLSALMYVSQMARPNFRIPSMTSITEIYTIFSRAMNRDLYGAVNIVTKSIRVVMVYMSFAVSMRVGSIFSTLKMSHSLIIHRAVHNMIPIMICSNRLFENISFM